MQRIRLLLLDDHALFRESLGRLLSTEPDFAIAGHAGSVAEALGIMQRETVDVVLLDYDLGEEHGLQFLTRAGEIGFTGQILLVTAGMTEAQSGQALRMGASGIFWKDRSPAVLAGAIRQVASGGIWLDQNRLRSAVSSSADAATEQRKALTERERQVLRGVFEGLSNKEIGVQLELSETAVKGSLQQLFAKMGVRTRGQLVRIALEQYQDQLR